MTDQEQAVSRGQRQVWFLDAFSGSSVAYHVPSAFVLTGPVEVDALQDALVQVATRHPQLGATYVRRGSQVRQVLSHVGEWPLDVVPELNSDLSASRDPGDLTAAAWAALDQEWRTPFNLARGPLLRASVQRWSPLRHVLVLDVHHINFDGTSEAVVLRQLGRAYRSLVATDASWDRTENEHAFADLVRQETVQENGGALARDVAYFEERFRRRSWVPSPASQIATGTAADLYTHRLAVDVVERLRAFCQAEHVTRFVALASAVAVAVGRTVVSGGGERAISLGVSVSTRTRLAYESAVGMFVNVIPVLITDPSLDGDGSRRVQAALHEAIGHGSASLGAIAARLPVLAGQPAAPVDLLLSYQPVPSPRLELPGVEAERIGVTRVPCRFGLEVHISDTGSAVEITWVVADGLAPAAIAPVAELVTGLQTALADLLESTVRPTCPPSTSPTPDGTVEATGKSMRVETHHRPSYDR